MTRAEYLEYIQECCAFPLNPNGQTAGAVLPMQESSPGLYPVDPAMQLRDTVEVCRALRLAHAAYCAEVEIILFPDRANEVRLELLGTQQLAGYEARLQDTMAVQPRPLGLPV